GCWRARGARAQEAGDDLALALPEVRLAVVLEDVGDGLASGALNLFVSVQERQIEACRQAAPHCRFAAAGHSHKHDRARAKVGADRADSGRLGPFAFASCAESGPLWRVSPLLCRQPPRLTRRLQVSLPLQDLAGSGRGISA